MSEKRGQELNPQAIAKALRCCVSTQFETGCKICPNNVRGSVEGILAPCDSFEIANAGVPVALIERAASMIEQFTAEGLWVYCPDDERNPRWKCSRCGKFVHKDPAEKLYCSACGQRNRKEA